MTNGACDDIFRKLDGTAVNYDPAQGGVFTIQSVGDAPTLQSLKYIFFGRVDVTVQAAPGAGIVTSFVLQSDDLDEIDIEWVGSDNTQFQSNYFSKGNTATYDRGAFHAVDNPTGSFHTYSLVWDKDSLQWMVDGAVLRTLNAADAEGGPSGYPQTPMQIKLGTWVGGAPGAPQGTIDWAGGLASFPGTYNAYYKSIVITDNEGGSTGAKQYIYSDNSGSWQSITVDGSGGNSTDDDSTSSSSDSSSSQTTLSTATSTASSNASATANANGTSTGGSGPKNTGAAGTSAPKTSPTAASDAASGRAFGIGSVALSGAALLLANLFFL